MDFREAFLLQVKQHKYYTPQDAVKLCYQAAFGPEHMLRDVDRARAYLEKECGDLAPKNEPLWEDISEDFVRVNLRTWLGERLPVSWLFELFLMTACLPLNGENAFRDYISCIRSLSDEGVLPFTLQEFDAWYDDYLSGGIRAVSHSDAYREVNLPSYRLISTRYLNLIRVLQRINHHPEIRVIAIDGMAGSGKTTLANDLQRALGCDLIRMDDFFLPLTLRTSERMEEPGGNIHYERFIEEVIPYVRGEEDFSYRRFDCGTMDYAGDVPVRGGNLRIVEGSYSCHPIFEDYADLRVFAETDPETQISRICSRNIPDWMVQRFRDSWIPMENRYHDAFQIREKAHILIKT